MMKMNKQTPSKSVKRLGSIRTRLLLAYGSIILMAFVAITLVAGQQIASAARADYERSLITEARLLSQQPVYWNTGDRLTVSALSLNDTGVIEIALPAETTQDRQISIIRVNPSFRSAIDFVRDRPEMEAALGGRWTVAQRASGDFQEGALFTAVQVNPSFLDEVNTGELSLAFSGDSATIAAELQQDATYEQVVLDGRATFSQEIVPALDAVTNSIDGVSDAVVPAVPSGLAAPIDAGEVFVAPARPTAMYFLQMGVPVADLDALILQRWALLLLLFGLVIVAALIATLWVSRTITKPLYALRESAIQLAQGDFTHRVDRIGQDEIGEVARAFNEMAQQVESMINEQRAFASNTSHELRTPLTTIRLRSEALRYDPLDVDTNQQYIAEIDDEVRRLSTLIEDLTLLSRFDAGRSELGKSEIDVRRFATSMMQQFQPQAAAKQITLTLESPQVGVTLYASLTHLTVAFRNVLDNALKYTPEGGSITMIISEEVDGICAIIEDTGQGIEQHHLPRLFERFFRVDKARSRQVPGTGLGLALVQSIVKAYGGSISIESDGLQQGTTVTIYWPYGSPAEQAETV
jgi:signal transduction histidine kinase